MPVLEELTLKSLIATVLNLEKLHTNLPTIKNLTLHNVRPCISAIPENITPATLTKLDYCSTFCENQVALPNWYQYMSIKYSNVTRIKYSDQNLQFIDMDVVQQMYENGFLQFLQLIGPSTPRHVLCKVPDGINVFEPLDNSGSKTKAFTFHDCQGGTLFEFLAQSNQARYVEEIKLYKTQIGTPDSLQSLTLLTQIDLNIDPTYHGTEIDFTSYLNGFPPSLERCDVKCSNLFVDPESTRSSRIKDLCIECEELTEALGDVLSNCFPNLVTLGLKADMPEHVVINIQSPDFKRATFINPMEQFEGCIFTVKSASQIEAYLWHSDSIKRMENVQDRGEPHITFTSAIQTESTVLGHNIQAILIAAFGSN
jgi:hypothetical protein